MLNLSGRAHAYAEEISVLSAHSRQSRLEVLLRALWFRARYGRGLRYIADHGFLGKPSRLFSNYIGFEEQYARQSAVALPGFRYLEEDKPAFRARCAALNVPACPILAVITLADVAVHGDQPRASSPRELASLLAGLGDGEVILKRADGGLGYGIYSATIQGGSMRLNQGDLGPSPEVGPVTSQSGQGDPARLFHWLRSLPYTSPAWILQPHLRPHPDLLPLMPGPGLGTVRIQSFLSRAGEVTLHWPLLKIPSSGSIIDNFRNGTGGIITAPIDLEKGSLPFGVGRKSPGLPLEEIAEHPLAGVKFEGFRLPHWEELKSIVTSAAQGFPELPALGWDVAITPSGAILLEANWEFCTDLIQATIRRGIKQEFHALFDDLAEPRPWETSEL